jgi:uncharacterized protein (DUF2249 family)
MRRPQHIRDLDLRPVLASGGDPFTLVLETARTLSPSETLHVVLDFDPTTLCAAMHSHGWSAETKRTADAALHVWIHRARLAEAARAERQHPQLRVPVQLDVRGLEPPRPVIVILERLVDLGPGAQLLVHDDHEPTILYDKLALRGYDARAEKRGPGDYFIHVAPAWVFEP